jgi:hypothetical protein
MVSQHPTLQGEVHLAQSKSLSQQITYYQIGSTGAARITAWQQQQPHEPNQKQMQFTTAQLASHILALAFF